MRFWRWSGREKVAPTPEVDDEFDDLDDDLDAEDEPASPATVAAARDIADTTLRGLGAHPTDQVTSDEGSPWWDSWAATLGDDDVEIDVQLASEDDIHVVVRCGREDPRHVPRNDAQTVTWYCYDGAWELSGAAPPRLVAWFDQFSADPLLQRLASRLGVRVGSSGELMVELAGASGVEAIGEADTIVATGRRMLDSLAGIVDEVAAELFDDLSTRRHPRGVDSQSRSVDAELAVVRAPEFVAGEVPPGHDEGYELGLRAWSSRLADPSRAELLLLNPADGFVSARFGHRAAIERPWEAQRAGATWLWSIGDDGHDLLLGTDDPARDAFGASFLAANQASLAGLVGHHAWSLQLGVDPDGAAWIEAEFNVGASSLDHAIDALPELRALGDAAVEVGAEYVQTFA